MARIRSIKPDFFRSRTLNRVDKVARLTFIGLWTYVDDNGVGLDEPRLITADLNPLEEDYAAELAGVISHMKALAVIGVIQRYSIGGENYFFVTNWDEHQKISHPAKARYWRPTAGRGNPPGVHPGIDGVSPETLRNPSGDSPETLSGTKNEPESNDRLILNGHSGRQDQSTGEPAGQNALWQSSGASPETLRPEQGAGSREQGKNLCSSEMSDGAPKSIKRASKRSDFEAFWKPWPRKVGKIKAEAAFVSAVKAGADPAAIAAASASYAERHRLAGTPKNKIPHPTTWLNRGSWDDDLDDAVPLPPGATPTVQPPSYGQPGPVGCRWCDGGLYERTDGRMDRCEHPDQPPANHPAAELTRSTT